MNRRAVYITRSNLSASWITPHANVYLKPLEVVSSYKTTLCVPADSQVPDSIAVRCSRIVYYHSFGSLFHLLERIVDKDTVLFTGFDFPCLFLARQLKHRKGCAWTMFLWDPPSLGYRDHYRWLRRLIDWMWRRLALSADRIVLNIHPGLLEEIGYHPSPGQVELRMQDAFRDLCPTKIENSPCLRYDIGVLSNWTWAKGGPLVSEALRRMGGVSCLWIGNPPSVKVSEAVTFAGRLTQQEAFARLRECRALLVPYLSVPSLKWNYPLKLFEYLQLGRPIVASDNPGVVAVANRHPGTIRLFRSGCVESLCEALRETIPQI